MQAEVTCYARKREGEIYVLKKCRLYKIMYRYNSSLCRYK